MRFVLAALAITFLADTARAVDITGCGQAVQDGEVGVLQADLDCAGTPGRCEVTGDPCLADAECAPWPCEPAIVLGSRATLDLNGHTLTNTTVQCDRSTSRGRRCTVRGPGQFVGDGAIRCISAGPHGQSGHLRVTDVDIAGCRFGIFTNVYGGSLLATNVTANDNVEDGIHSGKLRALNVTTSRNGGYGIFAERVRGVDVTANDNGETGVYPTSSHVSRARMRNLTATGNGEAGVLAYKLKLIDSVVTGNTYEGVDVDIAIIGLYDRFLAPRLLRTTCGHSRRVDLEDVLETFGVCAND